MKPDWSNQNYLLLIIPSLNSPFRGYYNQILKTYYEIISKSIRYQKIWLISKEKNNLIKKYSKYKNIKITYKDYNDIWARDIMPIQTNKKSVNFSFNAWGRKYPYKKDNALAKYLFSKSKKNNLIIEGGAIETNGLVAIGMEDTFFLNRNNISKNEMKEKLEDILDIKNMYFFNQVNLQGDDTDGHIDNLIRFANKDTCLYLKDDSLLKNMEDELFKFAKNNKIYNLIGLPLIKKYFLSRRLPASYLNFIQLEKIILLPKFYCSSDMKVLKIFKKIFNKKIIQIDSRYLIRESGGLHCASYQVYK
jgi:agmatine/peptidylarginine deiminase